MLQNSKSVIMKEGKTTVDLATVDIETLATMERQVPIKIFSCSEDSLNMVCQS